MAFRPVRSVERWARLCSFRLMFCRLALTADFVRFAGEEADLRLTEPVANARRVKGTLRGCDGGAAQGDIGQRSTESAP